MATANRRSARTSAGTTPPAAGARTLDDITPDRFRHFVFPNRIRETRYDRGFPKLMALSNRLADIPYIRLSKIERGEVVARGEELVRIAATLGVAPTALLVDADAPGFDIAHWAEPFHDPSAWDDSDERDAVLIGAALRFRRSRDRSLTIALLDRDYGLPAVILSRLENAHKPLRRWNDATHASLCRLFGAADLSDLVATLSAQYLRGDLDMYVRLITDPAARLERSRQRIAQLQAEIDADATGMPQPANPPSVQPGQRMPAGRALSRGAPRMLDVLGAPLQGGLIEAQATGVRVPALFDAGPNAFALRVCRATLGAGLPASAVVIVDPDRRPVLGSLAAVRVGNAYRLVTVTVDRTGATMGYSVAPDVSVNIDELDPGDVAGVLGALFA